MTVQKISPIVRLSYTGSGQYYFDFDLPSESDIKVYLIDFEGKSIALVKDSDYTVVKNSAPTIGGYIQTSALLGDSGTISIERSVQATQSDEWSAEGYIDLSKLENAFDKLVMLVQQLEALISSGSASASWRGSWAEDYLYHTKDIVTVPDGSWYTSIVEHTAVDWTADLAAGYWVKVLDMVELSGLVQQAAQSAYEATNSASSAAVAAASSAGVLSSVQSLATQAAVNAATATSDADRAEAAAALAEGITGVASRVDTINTDYHVATAGQVDFMITKPTSANNVMAFMNSRKLRLTEDYTLDNSLAATRLHLLFSSSAGDEIDIVSLNTAPASDLGAATIAAINSAVASAISGIAIGVPDEAWPRGTSPSNKTIVSSGLVTFSSQSGKNFVVGAEVKVASRTDLVGRYMYGTVYSYNPLTGDIVVDVAESKGTGTYYDWNIVSFNKFLLG